MTLLPIVGRELRVSSRKWMTYWGRVMAAAVALLIFSAIALVDHLSHGMMGMVGVQLGTFLFQTFGWLCFLFVLSAGAFFTSDTLSEEKREGTLGLLFLTDLRGYDVVLGKLLSGSLRGAYGLLAALPVIGLSFLLGGLSGGEFWRLALVLGNTLFFTLSVGLCLSALSRQGQRAMFGTLAVVFLFAGLTWLGDWALAGWDVAKFQSRLSLASPVKAFLQLRASRFDSFWTSMGIIHGLGWAFLIAACLAAPRVWQEKASRGRKEGRRRWFGSAAARAAWRRRLFDGNPVRWVAARERWPALVSAGGLLFILALYGWLLLGLSDSGMRTGLTMVLGWILMFVLVLSLASHASRFFVEAKSCGALELMLASPLSARDIVRGQWWALVRMFLVPALLVLGVRVWGGIEQLFGYWAAMAGNTNTGAAGFMDQYFISQCISLGLTVVKFFFTLLAVAWFAMWMGVTSRRANAAVLKTMLFVYVVPLLGLWFVQMILLISLSMLSGGFGGAGMPYWLPQLVVGLFSLGIDVMFFLLARRKLLGDFRGLVTRAAGVVERRSPPLLPAPAPAPRAASV